MLIILSYAVGLKRVVDLFERDVMHISQGIELRSRFNTLLSVHKYKRNAFVAVLIARNAAVPPKIRQSEVRSMTRGKRTVYAQVAHRPVATQKSGKVRIKLSLL